MTAYVCIPTDSWNYRVYGSDREKPVTLQPVHDLHHDMESSQSISTGSSLMLRNKRDSLMHGDSSVRLRKKALWSALTQQDRLTHLPEQLTRHEQSEGSIFALGFVGPVGNALKNQTTVFEWEARRGTKDDEESVPQSLPPVNLPVVPAAAPPHLLRNWLKDLRVHNPTLDGATIVMRAHNGKTLASASEESFMEDFDEPSESTARN